MQLICALASHLPPPFTSGGDLSKLPVPFVAQLAASTLTWLTKMLFSALGERTFLYLF